MQYAIDYWIEKGADPKKLILGKKDSEIHYHEIPVPIKTEEDTEE